MHLRGEGIWGRWLIVMESARGFITVCIAVCASFIISHTALAAGFSTNFQPTVSSGWVNQEGYCSFASTGCDGNNQWGNGDPTPFELSLVTVGGVTYFHTLVGDPASGFAIESYTQYGSGPNGTNGNSVQIGDFSPTGGGNARSAMDPATANDPMSLTFLQTNTNMANPFGDPVHTDIVGNPIAIAEISGSGSQTPSTTVFRMVMTSADGTMSMEAYKPFLDKKPLISQTIQDGSMSSVFAADMRGLSYADMNTPIKITNNLTINDPTIPTGSGNFEMALAQQPNVTAGRYTFTPGSGWDTNLGWDSPNSTYGFGTYTYADGAGFDPLTFNWGSVFDYSQNALNCLRVASGTGDSRLINNSGASCPGHP